MTRCGWHCGSATARATPVTAKLICHSDAGSQCVSLRCTERLTEAGVAPSVGSVGDAYDTQGMIVTVDVGSSGLTRLTTGGPEGPDPSYD
jgi:hypothetical protein